MTGDVDGARLEVRQTLTATGFSEPKTPTSARTVALDPATVTALGEHRRHQAAERLAWGPGYDDHGLVFAREDGSPLKPVQVTHMFQRVSRSLGLPVIGLHGLRHTWATLALRAQVHPKTEADRLGHASWIGT